MSRFIDLNKGTSFRVNMYRENGLQVLLKFLLKNIEYDVI